MVGLFPLVGCAGVEGQKAQQAKDTIDESGNKTRTGTNREAKETFAKHIGTVSLQTLFLMVHLGES
jgi:hypothetical protein